jgi:signal transduction histidine kinase
MRSLPIRVRLTLAFAVSMAIAFTVLGLFIHTQFRQDLERALDQGMRERFPVAEVAERGEFVQRYDAGGALVASSRDLAGRRLLTEAEARRAADRTLTIERRAVGDEELRVRGAAFGDGAAAVGEPLGLADRELRRLRNLLLIVFPLALVLASYAGYEVAGAALGPLERVRAREKRLVSDASHELRTPLTVLRTELQLALRGDRGVPELREALENALGETERLSRLADDLLVLARTDHGELPLRREAIDIATLLGERAGRARAHAGDRPITVAGAGTISADRDRIAQAVDNLLLNAVTHGAGEIALRAEASDGSVELHVLDDGPGFTDLDRAFERFAHEGPGGTGLGLAIVESIARAHGGSAGARNRPSGGADVWIALPRD